MNLYQVTPLDNNWTYDDEGKFYYKGVETKITQYCRYCSQLCYRDVAYYCDIKGVKSIESCKVPNRCKSFDFDPIDAFFENEKGYRPRRNKDENTK